MIGSAIIVFREVLEAALIIAIVLGASRGIDGRERWVGVGVSAGILGALVVAAFAGTISNAMDGIGQEIFNAAVLLAAVAMLGWHNAWMASHGRQMAADMRKVGDEVRVGAKPLTALAVVVALAVLREGSETVLFLYGIVAAGSGWGDTFVGGMIGLSCGAALGWIVYRGLLAIPLRYFFSAVSWMVLLLAAGLAASAAKFLNQAGLVPSLGYDIWDTSAILSQGSWLGTFLHILLGYVDRPMGIQILFYVVTLAVILALVWMRGSADQKKPAERRGS
jgi:high-affinity iron transporter